MTTSSASPVFANLADPDFRIGTMRRCVEAVRSEGTLWYPLLNLIATFLDGLASGAKGRTRSAYIAYVETNMPRLHAAVGAEVFYDNFRNAAVHKFSLKPGYAIGRNSGMPGVYSHHQAVPGLPGSTVVLNIDMLADEFLDHLVSLLALGTPKPSAP